MSLTAAAASKPRLSVARQSKPVSQRASIESIAKGFVRVPFSPGDASLSPVNLRERKFEVDRDLTSAFKSSFPYRVCRANEPSSSRSLVVRSFVSCLFANHVSARVCPVCRSVWMPRRKQRCRDCEDVPPGRLILR